MQGAKCRWKSQINNKTETKQTKTMKEKLLNQVRAGYSGLFIVSYEERRVEAELAGVARDAGFGLYAWSITEGIIDAINGTSSGQQDPMEMLEAFGKLPEKSILIARDFHMLMGDNNPVLIRKVKDVIAAGKASNRVFIVCGCQLKLPAELEKEMSVVEHKLPDKEQLKIVIDGIAQSAGITLNGNTDPICDAASGLTTTEAENAAAMSMIEAKDILPSIIAREKAATIKKNGILELIESQIALADIGGLDQLKLWMTKRRSAFSPAAKAYGLPTPKGCLLVGIPGCGKSLTAKATANILGTPLLKLDAGKLFGSMVGESERNVRGAIQTAEAIAPCVLWIDELEKGFSGSKSSGSTDGGTSARVFGTFLQWLQEKTSPVFVVATANDVSALPPELLRKGRFDETWFVDLPTPEERADIWRIQIGKFKRNAADFDIGRLAGMTEGFTGSEIESLFSEALFSAYDEDREPDDLLLAMLVGKVVPLSKMMAAEVDALRRWADGRARRATSQAVKSNAKRKLV